MIKFWQKHKRQIFFFTVGIVSIALSRIVWMWRNTDKRYKWIAVGISIVLLIFGASNLFIGVKKEGETLAAGESWVTGYTTRKKIEISHTNIDATLTDFPVLVKLSLSNFDFGVANSDGYDIRFASADGNTLLKYERERHASPDAEYWVKIPSVSSSATTDFYIYYRTTDTADGSDATNVWDANFLAVYHLNDDDTDTAVVNSIGTPDGTKVANAEPTQASGKIDSAQHLDGSNDNIKIESTTLLDGSTAHTIEAWVNFDTFGDWEGVVWERGSTGNGGIHQNNADKMSSYAQGRYSYSLTALSTGTWYHFAGTWDGTDALIYKDGANDSGVQLGTGSGGLGQDDYFYIGWDDHAADRHHDGLIDEVRISDIVRSDGWIKATYYSGDDNLLTFGIEESPAAVRRIIIIQ